MLSSEKVQWFAMRATYRRGMQIKVLLDKEGINNFIPMRYEVRVRNGRKRRELVPVISDLIIGHNDFLSVANVYHILKIRKFELHLLEFGLDGMNENQITDNGN